MSAKKTLLLYQEYREYFEMLGPDDCKALLLAIFDYNVGDDPEDLEGMAKMAFAFISNAMDRNDEKYQRRSQQSRENGKKGGRPPKEDKETQNNLENPVGFSETQETQQVFQKPRKPDKDKDKDKDKDIKDKNIVQNAGDFEPFSDAGAINCATYPQNPVASQASTCATDPEKSKSIAEARNLFEDLWLLYPLKRGKGSVSDTQKLKIAKIGKEEMVRAIDRYKADVAGADFDLSYKNGSTFFNSGFVDYLDANYTPRPKTKTGKDSGARTLRNKHIGADGHRDFSHLEE